MLRLAVLTLALGVLASPVGAQPPAGGGPEKPKLGLHVNDPRAFQGYTLLAPMMSKTTYLIDMEGRVVRQWESDGTPACSAYLLENGHLLRPCTVPQQGFEPDRGGGGFRSSPGRASWSGTTSIPPTSTCRTTTFAGCPTAT
jgi:hypothetical protein